MTRTPQLPPRISSVLSPHPLRCLQQTRGACLAKSSRLDDGRGARPVSHTELNTLLKRPESNGSKSRHTRGLINN